MVRSQAVTSWTIGRFAQQGGVGVETVRYYQRRGLLDAPDRLTGAGVRRYGEIDLRRLRFVRAAQSAGFTLEQIRELLDLDATQDRARVRALTEERIAALDLRIRELEQARASLRHLAGECGSSGSGPCPILAAFEQG
ncbi:MerR family transcriptional regulator [Sphingomonas aracearum]|uniref:Mercuric resistance operon regulatory protein n=1 Tax=Sphingomonas aracearum TaxID=2283317 RepID=A0A369VXZ6_9SPHN|nr:MerR family transcriptional regulator [Sphingomonas aracearum]RDE06487.1 MerR family transcriptional regulator [Sphingomonas aracearum]